MTRSAVASTEGRRWRDHRGQSEGGAGGERRWRGGGGGRRSDETPIRGEGGAEDGDGDSGREVGMEAARRELAGRCVVAAAIVLPAVALP
uniref:Uncharacterized protein n=1 Tax=Oryza nivara TaxID=4536 RepID=A0A0E0IQP0_ORYNI